MWARLLLVGEVSACRVSGVSRGIVCGKYMLKDVVAGCCASVQLLSFICEGNELLSLVEGRGR